jgi:hypothetical protein
MALAFCKDRNQKKASKGKVPPGGFIIDTFWRVNFMACSKKLGIHKWGEHSGYFLVA